MGSLDSDERFISKSLPISQLVEHIRYSFRERDFVEVQNALIERENDLKMEIESLVIERDSAKKEVCLVERSMKSIKRFKFEDKLEKSHNKWKKLEESVARLVNENRELKNLEKRAEEERDRIFADNMKLVIEKNKLVCELNKKVNEFESKNLENEENRKSLDTMEAKMGREIQELEKEKSGASKTVGELKVKVYESNRTIAELTGKLNELKRKNSESEAKMGQEIDELKKEKSGASKTIVELKGKVCESNMTIAELTRRLNELKRKNSESEQLARAGDEKCKSLNALVAKMGQEIDELKKEKSGASNTIVELKGKVCESNRMITELNRRLKKKYSESEQLARAGDEKCKSLDTQVAKMGQEIDKLKKEKSEASKTIVELNGAIIEANRTINDLREKKLKSDKFIELYRSQIKGLCLKFQKNKEVADVADLVTWEEGGNLNFQEYRGKTGSSGYGNMLHCAGDGSKSCGSLKKGCTSLVKCSTGENGASKVKTPGLPSGQNPLRMETKPLDSGPHARNTQSLAKRGFSSSIVHSPLSARNFVEISDSDEDEDQTKPKGSNHANLEQNIWSDFMGKLSANSTNGRNKNARASHEKENGVLKSTVEPKSDSRTPHKKLRLIDGDSSGSDCSCTDSKIEAFVASFRK